MILEDWMNLVRRYYWIAYDKVSQTGDPVMVRYWYKVQVDLARDLLAFGGRVLP